MRFALCVLAAVISTPAVAQSQCGPHDAIMKVLAEKFHEVPIGIGTSSDSSVVSELTVAAGGSWTLLVTNTVGVACIVAGGVNWNVSALPPKPGRAS